ncbi:peroxiredoxin family protein [Flagellimonas onchidii]|uniref:peroxiredoxin family protein n=1 Tax=Flagellimonas onchidii TaxID=2562684 RepID=UPI0010A5E851|nr:redoxin family protein [Allomuricauda onchidii]
MNYKTIKILITIIFASTSLIEGFSQEITEENYNKRIKEITEEYSAGMEELGRIYKLHPEKKDSLMLVVKQLDENYNKKNCQIALKYASLPNGLINVYMARTSIPKDTLLSFYNKLPTNKQKSTYGKTIKLHIDSKQIEIGDDFYNFQATDSNGNPFQLSDLKGNDIFLLYGGLGCIREDGRAFLKNFYNTIDKDDFKIVVFNSCSNVEEMKNLKTLYKLDFIFVDDFKKDHSPMKIIYGAQSTPTCFLINKDGKIIEKSIGLPTKKLNQIMTKASR